MILIADSSALIALAIVDKLEVLEDLFGEVYIPRAVYNEVNHKGKSKSKKLADFCKDKVLDITSNVNLNTTLGIGESEAIILYKEMDADFLLCDDKKAKNFARSFGVNVIGSLGILLQAKAKKLLPEVASLMKELKSSQVFIDDKTIELVLRMSNELP